MNDFILGFTVGILAITCVIILLWAGGYSMRSDIMLEGGFTSATGVKYTCNVESK